MDVDLRTLMGRMHMHRWSSGVRLSLFELPPGQVNQDDPSDLEPWIHVLTTDGQEFTAPEAGQLAADLSEAACMAAGIVPHS